MEHGDAQQLAIPNKKLRRDSEITWIDTQTIQCKGVKLRLTQGLRLKDSTAEVVSLFKNPHFVHDYVQSLEGIDVRNVVEVGVLHGGSAIFFWNLLSPEKLCCIEINSSAEHLTAYIEQQGLADRLSTYFSTNQADKPRLREILEARFGDEALDVVIDDASHLYTPSLATFEALFPRLRPGGLYFLEDWKVHALLAGHRRQPYGDEPPLHRLVHDLLNLSLLHPGIISKVTCRHNFVVFERGRSSMGPEDLDVRAMLDAHSRVVEF